MPVIITINKVHMALASAIAAQIALGFALLWSGIANLTAMHLHTTPEGITSVFPWFTVSYTLGVTLSGQLFARFGYLTLPVGGVLSALGYLSLSAGGNLTAAYACFTGPVGVGTGLAYMALVKMGRGLLPNHPGAGGGMVLMGYGLGALAWSGVASRIGDAGIILTIVGISVLLLTLIAWRLGIARLPKETLPSARDRQGERHPLRDPAFPRIFLGFLAIASSGLLVIGNSYAIARETLPGIVNGGILLASAVSLGSAVGRVTVGILGDRFGVGRTFSGVAGVMTVALVGLCFSVNRTLSIPFGIAVGWAFGGGLSLLPGMCDAAFGKRYGTQAFGYAFIAYAIGSITGKAFMSWSEGLWGSFKFASIAFMLLCAAAITLRVPDDKR